MVLIVHAPPYLEVKPVLHTENTTGFVRSASEMNLAENTFIIYCYTPYHF